MRNVIIDVTEYATYLNTHNVKVAFNLDTNDIDETIKNQEYLIKNTKTYIIPIYHVSDYFERRDLIDQFLDFPFIAVGGIAGGRYPEDIQMDFSNFVFTKTKDKIKVHGLGVTYVKMLFEYPWYSVDSTTWMSFERYAMSYGIKDKRLVKYLAAKEHYKYNTQLEIKHWLKVENQVTKLWEKRGIIWS